MSSSKQTKTSEKSLREQIEAALKAAARDARSGNRNAQSGRYNTTETA
jgi:hypothetical protein